MINVIVPIIDYFDKYVDMINEIAKKKNVMVYCGVLERYKEHCSFPKNVVVKVYQNSSQKEEIINSLHSIEKESGKILVVRRPLTTEEFKEIVESKEDIAIVKRSRSKVAVWWRNLWKKIIKSVFSFFFFEDISVVAFNENLFNLITSLTNLSYITRIDRFVGLEQEDILTLEKPPKKEYDRFSNVCQLISALLFFALCIVGSVILCTSVNLTVLIVMISIFICIIGLFVACVGLLNFARSIAIGRLRQGRAEEVFA